jgi:signal peptidase II
MHVMQRAGGAPLTSGAEYTGTEGRRRVGVLLIVAAVVAILDQVSKVLAVEHLSGGRVIEIIGEYFQLRLIRNPGAAFGLGGEFTVILAVVMVAVIVIILRMSRRLVSLPWAIGLGALLGGAIGNLGDRLFREPGPMRGHVIDFIDYAGFFVGNIADIAIVGGAALIALLSIRGIAYDGSSSTDREESGTGEGDRE